MPVPSNPVRGEFLNRYFRSGWAFLLPYLAAYLLYERAGWPVQCGATTALFPPFLVTLFSAMHLAHLAALGWIWYEFHRGRQWGERWLQLVPWLLLFALMLFPGLYLEFPADNWSHVERIYGWSGLEFVHQHYWWTKYSYFGAYTLLRLFGPEQALPILGFLGAGCSLGLAWQYYRLGRALHYPAGASFAFALLQWVLLGNSAFSFDRYYGISSTIIAQIAAIAAIRITSELLDPAAPAGDQLPGNWKGRWGRALAALIGLFTLIGFNHVQALPIALLGMGGIATGRLHRQRPAWLLASGAILLVASFGLALKPTLIATPGELAQLQPWLGDWHGFSLLNGGSPAAQRAVQVLGVFGVGSLLLALPLCWRRHPVGWLCLLPALFLLLPATALPFAVAYLRLRGAEDLVVYSRLFFAVPVALPYVHWLLELGERKSQSHLPWLVGTAAFLGLILIPPTYPWHNRLWHATTTIPHDLALRPAWDTISGLDQDAGQPPPVYATNGGTGYVIAARHAGRALWRRRLADSPMPVGTKVDDFSYLVRSMENPGTPVPVAFMLMPATASYTPVSFAALCSTHWQPQEALLAAYSGEPQLRALALEYGYARRPVAGVVEWYKRPPAARPEPGR